MIYFDQAASSYPKPEIVREKMMEALEGYSANPGRGEHRLANQAASTIFETRREAASLFGCSDPKHCLFYPNATIAINQAIKGLTWNKNDHIITTAVEHNAIRRPLEYIKRTFGVKVTYIDYTGDDEAIAKELQKAITRKTKLLALTHASNVTGDILPLEKLTKIAKEKDLITLVDGSQTVGHLEINMKKQNIDMLAFPGHKALLGPQGTGMLLINEAIELSPIHHGGTGGDSISEDQPETLPDRLESGTLNTPGIAGLLGALEQYKERKEDIVPRETMLTNRMIKGLENIKGVTVYRLNEEATERLPIVSFNVDDIMSHEVAMILDSHYDIAVRAGVHCSPLIHEHHETLEQGMIRASFNMYNKEEEVDRFIAAIKEIARSYRLLQEE